MNTLCVDLLCFLHLKPISTILLMALNVATTEPIVGLSLGFALVQSEYNCHHISLASLENPSGFSYAGALLRVAISFCCNQLKKVHNLGSRERKRGRYRTRCKLMHENSKAIQILTSSNNLKNANL